MRRWKRLHGIAAAAWRSVNESVTKMERQICRTRSPAGDKQLDAVSQCSGAKRRHGQRRDYAPAAWVEHRGGQNDQSYRSTPAKSFREADESFQLARQAVLLDEPGNRHVG